MNSVFQSLFFTAKYTNRTKICLHSFLVFSVVYFPFFALFS